MRQKLIEFEERKAIKELRDLTRKDQQRVVETIALGSFPQSS